MKDRHLVTVIDYGMGNLHSVLGALRYLGAQTTISSDPQHIKKADCLILPGVGSFRKAMLRIREAEMEDAILEAVTYKQRKVLGICLGMQLLGSYGTEDGGSSGLGLIPNRVEKFTADETNQLKIPHIGFNSTFFSQRKGLFRNLHNPADFYYVHSYRMRIGDLDARIASCTHGIEFLAAFDKDNICGTQFHPEKSQTNGLLLLKNFLEL